jgi:hypothetical protein
LITQGGKQLNAVEISKRITLLVNNSPPHTKLTPEWFIWPSGTLVIKTEYFALRNGTIVIADKDGRWPPVRIPFDEKYPAEIHWDRRFANGILAPSGEYQVAVSACNIYDLCSENSATIKIPWYAPVLPAATISTSIVEATQQHKPATQRPEVTKVPSVVDATDPNTETLVEKQVTYEASASVLSMIVLITLL